MDVWWMGGELPTLEDLYQLKLCQLSDFYWWVLLVDIQDVYYLLFGFHIVNDISIKINCIQRTTDQQELKLISIKLKGFDDGFGIRATWIIDHSFNNFEFLPLDQNLCKNLDEILLLERIKHSFLKPEQNPKHGKWWIYFQDLQLLLFRVLFSLAIILYLDFCVLDFIIEIFFKQQSYNPEVLFQL